MKRAQTKSLLQIKLCLLLILSGVVLPLATGVAQAEGYEQDVNVQFAFDPTISLTVSTSDIVIPVLAPGNSADSNIVNLGVSTNSPAGYSLTATVGNSTDYNTTDLVRAAENENDTPTTFTSLAYGVTTEALTEDNTWGYSFSTDGGTTWQGYSGLPLYSDTANTASLRSKLAPSDGTDNVQFKIGARAGRSQVAGTYQNVVNFSLVANPSTLAMEEVFAMAGATPTASGHYAMQDMTSTICAATGLVGEDSATQLVDRRDGKVYWVTKLADGHCWMTQNLALDLVSDSSASGYVALTSENTDLNQYGSNNYTSANGYTCSNADSSACKGSGEVITWLPERSTIASDALDSTSWQNSPTDPYSYNPGADNAVDATMNSAGAGAHALTGNYYNWPAAIASNDSGNFTSSTMDNVANNPKNSICPKGWRLPTISSEDGASDDSTNEFRRLNVLYNNNVTGSGAYARWLQAPLYFPRGGNVNAGTAMNTGSNGYWWSSTVIDDSTARDLALTPSVIYPERSNYRGNGFSLRCLAR